MCGIVGFVGSDRAVDHVIDGLRRLEYRGYDSAGVALAKLLVDPEFQDSIRARNAPRSQTTEDR